MSALSSRQRRLRRGVKSRKRQALLGVARVVAHLTGKHTYAQLVASDYRVLASASTVEPELRESLGGKFSNIAAAQRVGMRLAEKAVPLGVEKLAFDRGGIFS
jgi:large subunit ribosomal protein L18